MSGSFLPRVASVAAATAVLPAAAVVAQVEPIDEVFDFDEAMPAAGTWLGNVTTPQGTTSIGQLVIEYGANGTWSITATMPSLEILVASCSGAVVRDRRVRFSLPSPESDLRFDGSVREDGQRLSGTVSTETSPDHGTFDLARAPRPTDLPEPLAFAGELRTPSGAALQMTIVLARTPGGHWVGHLDFPAGGLHDLPLINVRQSQGTLSALVPGRRPALITADLGSGRQHLIGTFRQGGFAFEIDFDRVPLGGPPAGVKRPPMPAALLRPSWMIRRHVEPRWVLSGGHVIDVRTGAWRRGVNIVIAGDIIESIGTDDPPDGSRVVDISGRFVLPGLFDLHAHIQPFGPGGAPDSPQTAELMLALLEHGITTVRGLPLYSEFGLAVAARVNDGSLEGPTVIPASGLFEREPQRTSWGFGDAETARAWVLKEAMLGTRWIKIYNTMDTESLAAIAEEAHERGMLVCGHAEDVPPLEASTLGLDSVEHITGFPLSCGFTGTAPAGSLPQRIAWRWRHVDDEKARQLLEQFATNGTGWVPTLAVIEAMIERGGHDGAPAIEPDSLAGLREALEHGARLAVALHRMGGLVGLGTDFPIDGVVPGDSVHREMELLVEAGGATPLEALQIATIGSASILQLEGVAGTVEPGRAANLVVLSNNPLERISNTRSIELVVHDGRQLGDR